MHHSSPSGTGNILDRIARCEGYPRYVHADHGPESTASGKYGYLDGTWNGYGGYPTADVAPPDVQRAKAFELWQARGWAPWVCHS